MSKPLSELEMFDLLCAAYPGKFMESDEGFEDAQSFADNLTGWEEMADLLGRVAMMTMPIGSPLSGQAHHVLGEVQIGIDGNAYILAAVKRDIQQDFKHEQS